jgi:diaminohydroxyphosphoribosylaminopyrimidine deaminase / 5-amino-6-(5-phosphoribosylamino)uracil reductase
MAADARRGGARADGLGCRTHACASTDDGKVDLADALGHLAGRGINRILAEGGARMARALLEADLVDEVYLLSASKELGPSGLDALAGLPLSTITESGRFAGHRRGMAWG